MFPATYFVQECPICGRTSRFDWSIWAVVLLASTATDSLLPPIPPQLRSNPGNRAMACPSG